MRDDRAPDSQQLPRSDDPRPDVVIDPDAFAANYRGAHDPLDALWWLEHPGTPTPSGKPDPVDEVRSLRQRVYAPSATNADRRALTDAVNALAVEQDHVEHAVAAAAAVDPGPRDAERDPRDAAADDVWHTATALADFDGASLDGGWSRRRRVLGLSAIAALILIVAGAGLALTSAPRRAAPRVAASAPAAPKPTIGWISERVVIPGKQPGEITRSTIEKSRLLQNLENIQFSKTGYVFETACSGPQGSTMQWALVDSHGTTFGPGCQIECTGAREIARESADVANPSVVQIRLEPSRGVTIGYSIMKRN